MGIPRECKRLAEVDFPIAEVSRHSAREKSIRHGHPSTLHLWWARRPLAACRAVLMGLLLPDPCDPNCPADFKKEARKALRPVPGIADPKDDKALRKALLTFIADFANWDHSTNQTYLTAARTLVKAAHLPAGRQVAYEPPLVVDPFAGGGSIPLEALRVGCDAFASDLNPVACLILKVLLEDIPRHGAELADELRRIGAEIKAAAEKELAQYYPCLPEVEDRRQAPDPQPGKSYVYALRCCDGSIYIGLTDDIPCRIEQHEAGSVDWTSHRLPVELVHWEQCDSREEAAIREKKLKSGSGREWLKRKVDARPASAGAPAGKPIAYLWARTVRCESPNCGAEIPLMRSFWLCRKPNRRRALRYNINRKDAKTPSVEFEIFEPKSENDVPQGTVSRANATCPCCGMVLPAPRVRAQLAAQRGGADVVFDEKGNRVGGARLLAVVTLKNGASGRHYRLPTDADYAAVYAAQKAVAKLPKGAVPDEPLPKERVRGSSGFRVLLYGMETFGDLFTARQSLALVTVARMIGDLHDSNLPHGALQDLAAISLSRVAPQWSALSWWQASGDFVVSAFARQALPIVWDFAECVPWTNSSGSFAGAVEWVARVISEECHAVTSGGQTEIADATKHPLPTETAKLWFTDPPYYDAVAYGDLADFFFVWLKRQLPNHPLLKDPNHSNNQLTPKRREAIVDPARTHNSRPKDRGFFEDMMASAFTEGRRLLFDEGVGCVVFAHKSTEGWEALLSALLHGGWVIVASWPLTTERSARPIAHDSAALSASIHLICRPRPADASVGGWEDILRQLPSRIGDWMERLAGEGIRGADLVFSCIGPAMELFSRHPRVETAEGRTVELPEFLEKVWEVVGRTALEQILGTAEARARNSAAGVLEEDARLTALFLWTLQSTNGAESKGKDETEVEDDEAPQSTLRNRKSHSGYALIYDIARRFAQPLGIHLDEWEGRIIETEKGVVKLLPVSARAQQLFGREGAVAMAEAFEHGRVRDPQMMLFPEEETTAGAPKVRGRSKKTRGESEPAGTAHREPTTLDRLHAAMLLQASGQSGALRALLEDEQRRGPDFFRLANALSALYPRKSEERRLVEAVLGAAPRR
ncbi:MAG: DUF1156 domain-containing protein [Armatimonadetes bacterium]|nr:DUF1156 domain-containing protein [Armatimonadota bacterium]NIN06840.1 DUF1156 domain-containing protein [Armatimonadota bacterium]NIT32137.1 DUF1156 domain-containing protein [Armatimonadota bacterium]